MRECPDIAKSEIEALQADGVEVTLDDIVWLASLGHKVEYPGGRSVNPLKSGWPVAVGNVALYSLTLQGSMFLDLAVSEGWLTEEDQIPLMAWVLARGRDSGAFDEIDSANKYRKELNRFMSGCTATMHELADAVALLIDDDAPDRARPGSMDYAEYLSSLEAATGQPADSFKPRGFEETGAILHHAYGMRHGFEGSKGTERLQIQEAMKDLMSAVKEIRDRESSNGEA